MIEERGVRMAMRDGPVLVADVFRPDTDARRPVLVGRTPYGRANASSPDGTARLVDAGFAVVVQDCRGWHDSGGEWRYARSEVLDGYDTVEWAAAQPWSNGRVGMFGASYMANCQWMAAIARPPHLEAIAPECCPADYWSASFEAGGPFRLALRVSWTASMLAALAGSAGKGGMAGSSGLDHPVLAELDKANTEIFRKAGQTGQAGTVGGAAGGAGHADLDRLAQAEEDARKLLHDLYRSRPLRGMSVWGDRAEWFEEIFDHEQRDDAYWRGIAPSTHYDALDLPAVHVAGWYDVHLRGTVANFTSMRRQAPTGCARDGQRLIVGPWAHWSPDRPVVGDRDFGPAATLDTVGMRVAWFRHHLQDGPAPRWSPVRIFVMGDDEWRDEDEWPLARARATSWYLRADGGLDTRPPGREPPDRFRYDPRSPVPTLGGRVLAMAERAGPADQRPNLDRSDVVVYRSEPLAADTEITGPVLADLWVATDAPDTDVVAILMDVQPDGTAYNLAEGATRARQAGLPMPLLPGAAYRFTVDLGPTSVVVAAGHHLALAVSSSSFPLWEPNPNTGRPLGVDGPDDLRVADQTVFHDAVHPSRVVLPVVPR